MKMTPKSTGQAVRLYMTLLLILFNQGGSASVAAQVQKAGHQHRARADMLTELRSSVSLVRVAPLKEGERENVCTTRNRRFTAYTVSLETERLFIKDNRYKIVYELQGIPLEYRPFSDLKWSSQNSLQFDRWSQPHHGMHYELDIGQKKLVRAYAFPD